MYNIILLWCCDISTMSQYAFFTIQIVGLWIVKFQPIIDPKMLNFSFYPFDNCQKFFFKNHQSKSYNTWHHSWIKLKTLFGIISVDIYNLTRLCLLTKFHPCLLIKYTICLQKFKDWFLYSLIKFCFFKKDNTFITHLIKFLMPQLSLIHITLSGSYNYFSFNYTSLK